MQPHNAPAGSWRTISPPLHPCIQSTLDLLGFAEMTPVQATAIPLMLEGKDVVAEAVTGSGKTLAFLLPILQRLLKGNHFRNRPEEVGAIVISPTRELAVQTKTVLDAFLMKPQHTTDIKDEDTLGVPLTASLCIGGKSDRPEETNVLDHEEEVSKEVQSIQAKNHRTQWGANIIIATPGRLEQALQASKLRVKALDMLVLDEADRLLQMGFEASLNAIFAKLPKQRRTSLFSATMADQTLDVLIRAGLRHPVRVLVKVQPKHTALEQKIPDTLHFSAMVVPARAKWTTLLQLLAQHQDQKTIVYFATCYCVDYFHKLAQLMRSNASSNGASAGASGWHGLHGKMEMKKRSSIYKQFTAQHAGVLFCTDVAARGLDIPDVDLVIQYDPPQDPQSVVHRSGRTARNGRSGTAILFLQENEAPYVDFLRLRQIPISLTTPPLSPATSSDTTMSASLSVAERMSPAMISKRVLGDRDMHDRGVRAFVSYLQMYRKHQASYLFRIDQLDMQGLVHGFYLLRAPKCPEITDAMHVEGCAQSFLGMTIDALETTLKYKDPQKQAAHEAKMEAAQRHKATQSQKRQIEKQKLKNTVAWSDRTVTKQKREERKDKKAAKRKAHDPHHQDTEVYDEEAEWKELQMEMRKIKKAKKGLLTESDDDDDEEDQ